MNLAYRAFLSSPADAMMTESICARFQDERKRIERLSTRGQATDREIEEGGKAMVVEWLCPGLRPTRSNRPRLLHCKVILLDEHELLQDVLVSSISRFDSSPTDSFLPSASSPFGRREAFNRSITAEPYSFPSGLESITSIPTNYRYSACRFSFQFLILGDLLLLLFLTGPSLRLSRTHVVLKTHASQNRRHDERRAATTKSYTSSCAQENNRARALLLYNRGAIIRTSCKRAIRTPSYNLAELIAFPLAARF